MKKKLSAFIYRYVILALVRFFYPKTKVFGAEYLPDEPCIIVGNHAQMNGPIIAEIYMPVKRYTWCIGEMMHMKEVPAYAYRDFWSGKPLYIRWFYRILSYVIAPLAVCIFNNANCIGVYHDMRIMQTFRETADKLAQGYSIVIFPECYDPYSNIVNQFQERFVDVARLYHKKTGKSLAFVPMYIAPAFHAAYLGEPVRYDETSPHDKERDRICQELMAAITAMGRSLPEHTVVPYANVPKREYPSSKESVHEETRC